MNIDNLSFCTEISDKQASTINGGYIDYTTLYCDPTMYTTTEIIPRYPWWEPIDFGGYLGFF